MSQNRQILREQTRQQLDAAAALTRVHPPKLGWIKTTRLALGMTGTALSQRLGGTRSLAANLERSEQEGRVTLKSMHDAAEAMNCRFVYAIVPVAPKGRDEPGSIDAIVDSQAEQVARRMVREAGLNTALEAQQLDQDQTEREVLRLKQQLLYELPRDLWAPPVVALNGGLQPILAGDNVFTDSYIAALIGKAAREGVPGVKI